MKGSSQRVVLVGVLSVLALSAGAGDRAAPRTVCTMTVNSTDEREAFRKGLPADRFEMVELLPTLSRSRDWVGEACRRGIRCDVLVISGHFAGAEFYSSKPEVRETVRVEDIERAQCGDCQPLFANLSEVYLFGCDSLKAEPTASAMPEIVRGLTSAGMPAADAARLAKALSVRQGEASRDLMRRLFPGVPAIYGFASLAPYGRVAGPMLERYFAGAPAVEVGSGVPSARLLSIFAPSSLVVERGMLPGDPGAELRGEACLAVDPHATPGARAALLHAWLAAPMPELRMAFAAAERLVAGWREGGADPEAVAQARAAIAGDEAARSRYLAVTRDTGDPALRARMIALAQAVGWLDAAGVRAEHARLVRDRLASDSLAFGDVDLACELNRDDALAAFDIDLRTRSMRVAQRAVLACLGREDRRAEVLRAFASTDPADVNVARAYLRHRPLRDAAEMRTVGYAVARMASPEAQARALQGLARLGVTDAEVMGELARLYARTRSAAVQDAVAEIFLRADASAYDAAALVRILREHRVQSGGLVEVLLDKLEGGRAPQSPAASTRIQTKVPEPS